jgi:hypothetical protein
MTEPEAIADAEDLYRRIVPYDIKKDGSVSSAAFMKDRGKSPDNEISVEIARLTTPIECATRYGDRGFNVIAVNAGEARQLGFEIRHDPLPDCYPHALIVGSNTRDLCQQLAAASRVVSLDRRSSPLGGYRFPIDRTHVTNLDCDQSESLRSPRFRNRSVSLSMNAAWC